MSEQMGILAYVEEEVRKAHEDYNASYKAYIENPENDRHTDKDLYGECEYDRGWLNALEEAQEWFKFLVAAVQQGKVKIKQ